MSNVSFIWEFKPQNKTWVLFPALIYFSRKEDSGCIDLTLAWLCFGITLRWQ